MCCNMFIFIFCSIGYASSEEGMEGERKTGGKTYIRYNFWSLEHSMSRDSSLYTYIFVFTVLSSSKHIL